MRAGYWLLATALILPGAVALVGMLTQDSRPDSVGLSMTALYVAVGLALASRLVRHRR